MSKRIKALFPIAAALVLALLCELLVFNTKALTGRGGEWTPLPAPEISGDLAENKYLTLTFRALNTEIRRCHILIEIRDEGGNTAATSFTVSISDDGNAAPYKAGTVSYTPSHDKGSYFGLNSYGNVHDLSILLTAPETGCTWKLLVAEINGSVPFRFSAMRFLGLFGLCVLLWLLRPGSVLYDNCIWNRRRWVKAVCVLMILAVNAGALFRLARSNRTFVQMTSSPYVAHHYQYPRLARALAEGRTWIDTDEQRDIMALFEQLKNPYDPSERTALFQENEIVYAWDTAYYDGHLYVYFGVVPVILTYLPYYLLTGNDLSTIYVAILSGTLAVIAAFALMRALIRRYFPRTPFPVYVLLSLLMGNCTGVLCYAVDPCFYIVPINFSLAFVQLALAFWFSAADRWTFALHGAGEAYTPDGLCFAPIRSAGRPGGIGLRIAAGGLFAALVAGCRPQFLAFSVLALPVFWPLVREENRRAVTVRRILVFALPYVAVAIPLMYYNAIRFGSPFDFGANYNLTTNDMPRRGFRLMRLPDGFFAYLFRLPNVELHFPFVRAAATNPVYMGKTIAEPMFGGVFLVFPFLWMLLGAGRVRPLLRERRAGWLVWLPLLLAVLIVAADTEMAGILWRYTGDFLPLLYLAATFVFLARLTEADQAQRRRLLGFLLVVTLLALLTCLLISMTNSTFIKRSPESYFRLKDLMSPG